MRRSPCPDAALPSTGFQGHFGGYERDLPLVHGTGALLFKAIPGWLLTQIPRENTQHKQFVKIIAIAATSLDGYITKHNEEGNAFTSPEDKRYFTEALKLFDSSILSSKIFEVMKDHILNTLTVDRIRVILTRHPNRYKKYESKDALVFRKPEPEAVVAKLQSVGRRKCALLGGKTVYSQFLTAGMIDEFWITLEPKIFGYGTSMFEGQFEQNLSLMHVEELNSGVLVLKYRVIK